MKGASKILLCRSIPNLMTYHIFTARVAKQPRVMFSQASVILSTQRGGGGGEASTPPRNTTPIPPEHNTHPPGRQSTSEYGQYAGGTHPTGMHPCLFGIDTKFYSMADIKISNCCLCNLRLSLEILHVKLTIKYF